LPKIPKKRSGDAPYIILKRTFKRIYVQRKSAVTYLRVSTQRQGASGLGIEAQRAAVETFCRDHRHHVAEEFVEVESGQHSARPGLRDALNRAKASRARLVIAKLDRLDRDVEFIAHLMNSDVNFAACDLPKQIV